MSPPVPSSIPAYASYLWDSDTHRLESRPELGAQDFGGMEVGLCRAEGALGGRVKVVAGPAGVDSYTPANIRSLQNLMGLSPASSVIILDREAIFPGHICIQATDPHWVQTMAQRVEEECVPALGKDDPLNPARCESLLRTLQTTVRAENSWDSFVRTLPVGLGFFVPGAVAAGFGLATRAAWNWFRAGPPVSAGSLVILPTCPNGDFPTIGATELICPSGGA